MAEHTQVAGGRDLSAFVGSLIVLASGVVVSFSGLAFRLTDDVNAWQFIVFRGLGAFVVTVVLLTIRHRRRYWEVGASIERSHLVAGLLLGLLSGIFIFALEQASVAFVMFLQTLGPLAAAYFSWIMLRERVAAAVLIATAVALVGVVIMFSATLTDRVDPLGLVAIAIPIMFGLYATIIRGAPTIDAQIPVVVAGLTLVAVGVVGAIFEGGLAVSVHDAAIGAFAGGFLLAIPVAFLNYATRVVPAPEVALLLMVEIILAPVWVWLFVDEAPAATTLIGGSVIFAAVLGLLLWRRLAAEADPSTRHRAWRPRGLF